MVLPQQTSITSTQTGLDITELMNLMITMMIVMMMMGMMSNMMKSFSVG